MSFKSIAAGIAALSLASAPIVAQAAPAPRAADTVSSASEELGGGGGLAALIIIAIAAAGMFFVAQSDGPPASP